ncbi:hypothetical protein WJX74_006572 [Apatococcus lobatus]|uniref:Uncharacterized protein n=2 Tax=Apatococcus TaxID=904362 RepID=A0AAW1TAC9_9CHLO
MAIGVWLHQRRTSLLWPEQALLPADAGARRDGSDAAVGHGASQRQRGGQSAVPPPARINLRLSVRAPPSALAHARPISHDS